MHLNIQGHHLDITPALNELVKSKIKKIKSHFDHIIYAHVILEVIKNEKNAEATLSIEHHHFHNKCSTEDMYKSIDLLFDKIENQVMRYKDRRMVPHSNDSRSHFSELSEAQRSQNIVIEELRMAPKPMSELEAVLQVEAGDSPLLGFHQIGHPAYPSFAIQNGSKGQYDLIEFEDHWTKKKVTLDRGKLEVHTVENIPLPIETIESAVDFIDRNDRSYRFFKSVLADAPTLVFKSKKKHYRITVAHAQPAK